MRNFEQYNNRTHEFRDFPDFTIAACRFVYELNDIIRMSEILGSVAGDHGGNPVVFAPPIALEIKKIPSDPSSDKTFSFITFPLGVLRNLDELSREHGINIPDCVRFCDKYYLDVLNSRLDYRDDLQAAVEEAAIAARWKYAEGKFNQKSE